MRPQLLVQVSIPSTTVSRLLFVLHGSHQADDRIPDGPRLIGHPALWTTRAIDPRAVSTLRPARRQSISEQLRKKKLEGEMLTLPADGQGTLGELLAGPSPGTS